MFGHKKEVQYPISIEVEHAVHTASHPFCDDMQCPCHDDKDACQMVDNAILDGTLSWWDAVNYYTGETV